jgi:metal-responsive CopG/Arc/MetJ family transcriptional regulator
VSYKVQITLPENLAADLKREAARRETSISEFIRETMREKLANGTAHTDNHPFASIIGILEDGEPDLAARVDEILYR